MFEPQVSFRNVFRGLVFLMLVVFGGAAWFALIEGYGVVDALYMTIITISTVGFREVGELDASGKIFVIFLIISGLTVLTYTLGSVGQVIVEGSIARYVGRRRMLHEIENMNGRYIVCGHGRMVFNPGPGLLLEKGDILIALGSREQLARLHQALD